VPHFAELITWGITVSYKRHPLAIAIIAAVAAPFTQAAVAQTAPEETTLAPVKVKEKIANDDYAPVTSSVGAKTPTPIRDIPQTVNVINRAVLDAQGATSLKEALRNVPGITISAGEGGQIGDNINLRGFSARTDVYIDGFRDRGQYTRDTFYLDSVEVLKGSSSMLFGRGSTGGVINQNSKKPDLNARGEVTVSAGTHDFYRTTLDINQPIADNAAFRIAAFGQDVQSTRDVVQNKDFGFAPSLRLGIGGTTEFIFSALIQRNNDMPDYGVPLIRSDRTANSISKPLDSTSEHYYGYLDDHFDQDVDTFNATIKHKFNDRVTLTNRTQYAQYRTVALPSPLSAAVIVGQTGAAAIPTTDTPLALIQASRQDRDRTINDSTISNQTDVILKFGDGDIRHTVTTGIEFDLDRYNNDTYTWDTAAQARFINLDDPQNGYRSGTKFKSLDTQVTADTFAVYANDQIDFGKQWKVVGGLRWDRFRADIDQVGFINSAGVITVDPTATRTYSGSQIAKLLSVRAGVIWQPSDVQSYYISYGTSFNPSAEGLTLPKAQLDVDPEKNRSYELGAKWDLLDGDLQLNGAVFQIEKTNARTTVADVVTLSGDLQVRGFELSAVGRIAPEWQVLAGYTRLDGKVIESPETTTIVVEDATSPVTLTAEGNTLQNTPKDTATLWTTYNVTSNWQIGGGAVYSSKRNVNNYENAIIDGYTHFDATIAYRQKQFGVRLNLQNLTNEVYYETASSGRATPASGRTAIVTTSFWF
jgi:catecholate siderophore receptor